MERTSIISVNFNQPQVTVDFLRSVKQHTSTENTEVILIDNGSREDHEEAFKAVYPELVYIRSPDNMGFAGGNNLGVKVAKGDFLLFLNNDTEIVAHTVEVMKTEFKLHPEIGLLSPLILYYDQPDTIQYAGFTEMDYLTCRNRGIGQMEENQGQYAQDSRPTGYCHGAAMMCKRDDLKSAGLMAEMFFLYYEELDWCEQFKKAGKKIWFTGRTRIYHKESISVGKESSIKTYFMTRNRMLFIRRNTNILNTIFFSLYYILFACSKQMLVYFFKGRTDLIKWIFKGIAWNFTHSKNSNNIGFKL